ncbi:MAG TPA: transposase [Planctomycetaceae bacterium]|nr:transposase [Planctomycetaceae bacterium]
MVAVDLESLVHQDHLLRKADRILETSFIRKLTAACYVSGVGRPSIDPEVFFRMLLVAYLYGIKSDRQLCEDVHHNFAYRWFCRLSLHDKAPHSFLSRIRDRYGEDIFEALFRRIVEMCQKRGLVGSQCRVMVAALWCCLITRFQDALNDLTPTTPLAKKPTYATGPFDLRRGPKDLWSSVVAPGASPR